MSHDPQWFFRLDELDLLESVYQSLSEDVPQEGERKRACERVFAEQEEAEKRSEEMVETLLKDLSLEGECPVHHEHHEEMRVEDLLATSAVRSHPLAARAYRFFRVLTQALKQLPHDVLFEDVFRIKANAPLIPAKIAFAGIELEHDDSVSLIIAEKELEVAEVYLSRLLTSLTAVCLAELLPVAETSVFLQEGEWLRVAVANERKQLRLRKNFRAL